MRSLALLLVALTGLIAFEGCGSDTAPTKGPQAGLCNNVMCPIPPTGKACCVNNACGVDPGNGCIPTAHPDAGAH